MTTELKRRMIGALDIFFATGGTGAAETFTYTTDDGFVLTLTKIDASHLKFRTAQDGYAKSLEDLVDGGKDVNLQIKNLDMAGNLEVDGDVNVTGTLTVSDAVVFNDTVVIDGLTAGIVKSNVNGLLSVAELLASELPDEIDAAKIADGSVSNAKFQYLGNVTSDIQTQINNKLTSSGFSSQAEQEAGTETAKAVAPATQQFHQSAVKAFVAFNGTGTVAILRSYNVTSITDNATGNYDANITNAFSDANLCIAGFAGRANGAGVSGSGVCKRQSVTMTGSLIPITTWGGTTMNAEDVPYVSIVIMGDLA